MPFQIRFLIQQVIRGEYTGILAKIIKDFDDIFISDMKSLTSNDPEVDFFENIKHIQVCVHYCCYIFTFIN